MTEWTPDTEHSYPTRYLEAAEAVPGRLDQLAEAVADGTQVTRIAIGPGVWTSGYRDAITAADGAVVSLASRQAVTGVMTGNVPSNPIDCRGYHTMRVRAILTGGGSVGLTAVLYDSAFKGEVSPDSDGQVLAATSRTDGTNPLTAAVDIMLNGASFVDLLATSLATATNVKLEYMLLR